MLTCPVPTLGCTSSRAARHALKRVAPARKAFRGDLSLKHRRASTAAAVAKNPGRSQTPYPGTPETLTVLHKASNYLPRVLPRGTYSTSLSTSLEFWDEVLNEAQNGLSFYANDPVARIVIYPCGDSSGSRDLVTALLEEPFSSEGAKQAVRQRGKSGNDENIRIRYSTQPSPHPSISIQSSWLQQFPIPVEVHEVPVTNNLNSKVAVSLHTADVPIIVCNPVTKPLSKLFADPTIPLYHPNAILVINSSPNLTHALEGVVPPSLRKLTILVVDPARALFGLQTISSNSTSPVAVQQYQDNFTGSNVSAVTTAIKQRFAAASERHPNPLVYLRLQTALHALQASLSASRTVLTAAEHEVDSVHMSVGELKDAIAELRARIHSEIFGVDQKNEVKLAVSKAKQDVRTTMDRLTWWRLLWKVDDIADTVMFGVNKAWCGELEDKLIYHTGRLAVQQQSLTSAANKLLASFSAPSPFRSPVLQNELDQIEASPTFPLKPHSLTGPIYSRRNQLTYPTRMLHASAQRVIVGMGSSVLGGLGVAWAGWAEQLGVFGSLQLGIEGQTAMGLGAFGAAAGIRWAVGRWEKAKRRWWQDWDRVGEGLARDLEASLHNAVDEQVVAVPEAACKGLCRLLEQREEQIASLKDDLRTSELDAETLARTMLKQ
ncbi:hypothetical protein K474DRAFT_1646119 [Panus rudis PR-1116 ss-1]|nr:hypothetical protein K474DRAFT_1646119 [Panus rudis PR-1116 ss-1]